MPVTTAIVTDSGIAAAVAAGTSGPLIEITGFKLGSKSMAEGAQALATDTDVEELVYVGTADQMVYSVIREDTVLYRITLETNIGNFDIGNVGLIMPGGTLFAKAVLPQKTPKWRNDLPAVVGNRKVLDVVLVLTNQTAIVDLTILVANECSLPEVATEVQLPNPSITPYNTWQVRNHTMIGTPVIAFRMNGRWNFSPERALAGQGHTILPVNQNLFASDADINKTISLDNVSNTYILGKPGSEVAPVIGVRSSLHEITILGLYQNLNANWTPGQKLYMGTGDIQGQITTQVTGFYIGFALKPTLAWVDFTGGSADTTDVFIQYFNAHLSSTKVRSIPEEWQTIKTMGDDERQRYVLFSSVVTNRSDHLNDLYYRILDSADNSIPLAWDMAVDEWEVYDTTIKMIVLMPGDRLQVKAEFGDLMDFCITGVDIDDPTLFRYDKNLVSAEWVPFVPTNELKNFTMQSVIFVNTHDASITLPVSMRRFSDNQGYSFIRNHPVPPNSSLEICDKEQRLSAGNELQVASSDLGGMHVCMSGRIWS